MTPIAPLPPLRERAEPPQILRADLVVVRNEKVRRRRVQATVQIEHLPPHVHVQEVVVREDERERAD